MDKTKEYLAVLQKHHFWVICGVVVIASLLSWYMAASHIDQEFENQKTLVEGKFTAMTGVANTADHPNTVVTDKLRKRVLGIKDNVFKAWQVRYEEQQKVPQWQGDLSQRFMDFVRTQPPTAKFPVGLLEEYRDFVRVEIDKLFEQVNARHLVPIQNPMNPMAPSTGPLRSGDMANVAVGVTHEWKGLVAWDETQREALRQLYYWDRRPTSQQVRYANEDLWIYRALLDIIVKTNRQDDGTPIKEHLLANVKKIEALNIGQLVPPPALFVAIAATPGEGGMTMEGGEGEGLGMPEAPGAPGGEGGEGGVGTTTNPEEYTNNVLKHLRYVDAKGRPLGYLEPEPYAEFKIMPFQMQLIMDQRQIPKLLAECANSPLPVEVRQVSIQAMEPPGQGVSTGGEGGRSMPGMMQGGMNRMMFGGEGGGYGGARMPQRSMSMGEGSVGGANDLGGALELRPFDLHVEIRGVVYIFNPPDPTKVGKQGEDGQADEAAVEAGAG